MPSLTSIPPNYWLVWWSLELSGSELPGLSHIYTEGAVSRAQIISDNNVLSDLCMQSLSFSPLDKHSGFQRPHLTGWKIFPLSCHQTDKCSPSQFSTEQVVGGDGYDVLTTPGRGGQWWLNVWHPAIVVLSLYLHTWVHMEGFSISHSH